MRKVTHIAIPDVRGKILAHAVPQEGVILFPYGQANVCASVTDSQFAVTTEVYPDSKGMTQEQCNSAQVASIVGALEYYLYPLGY